MRFFARSLVMAAALPLIPFTAWACPACMVTDPKNASTYLGMTLMMSILPLGMLGGLIYWFRRCYSQEPRAASQPRPVRASEFLAEIAESPSHPFKTA